MSNQITIQPTKFVNVRSGSSSLDVRVYDSYGQSYTNTRLLISEGLITLGKKLNTYSLMMKK